MKSCVSLYFQCSILTAVSLRFTGFADLFVKSDFFTFITLLFITRSELRKILCLALSVTFLFDLFVCV